jgi:glyoxylase-like metal-dependent hydrolase (beta-lactamase superfamily II)
MTALTLLLLLQQPPDPAKVEVKTHRLAGSVSMIEGAGGNIGVSVGEDGVFVIDDQFAPLAPKIKAAIALLSPRPLRFLINTHWHGDHTGGNQAMAQAGALIVAQDNVRKRLSTTQNLEAFHRTVPPAPAQALPVVTFSEEVTFYLNGDTVHVMHVPAAHTDGDAIIHFQKANVIHMGDTFFNGAYPVIDYSSGGTVDGVLLAQEKVLGMIDANTKLIPGHGPVGDRAALQAAHDLLKQARDRVAKLRAQGKTLEQTIAARPTAEWDAKWATPFVKPEVLVTMIYETLPKRPGARK